MVEETSARLDNTVLGAYVLLVFVAPSALLTILWISQH